MEWEGRRGETNINASLPLVDRYGFLRRWLLYNCRSTVSTYANASSHQRAAGDQSVNDRPTLYQHRSQLPTSNKWRNRMLPLLWEGVLLQRGAPQVCGNARGIVSEKRIDARNSVCGKFPLEITRQSRRWFATKGVQNERKRVSLFPCWLYRIIIVKMHFVVVTLF